MSGHTPGPWKLDRQQHAEVVHADGVVIADVFTPQETMFATMRTASPCEYEQAEANARLIAAAPALLEALKNARLWMGARRDVGEYVHEIAEADNAIAQAEGKE